MELELKVWSSQDRVCNLVVGAFWIRGSVILLRVCGVRVRTR